MEIPIVKPGMGLGLGLARDSGVRLGHVHDSKLGFGGPGHRQNPTRADFRDTPGPNHAALLSRWRRDNVRRQSQNKAGPCQLAKYSIVHQ